MSYCYLEITRGAELGKRFLMPDGAISIGRSQQNNIVMHASEKNVSGHHMIIYKSPERIMMQDLQSTNGSFLNEIKISEKEVAPGDSIGFGKDGPRLKLIVSETELDTYARREDDPPVSNARTQEDRRTSFVKSASREALRSGIDVPDEDSPLRHTKTKKTDTSLTMELHQRIADKNLDADDMKNLMKDGKRLERVLEQGTLGQTQTSMLRSMYTANKSMQRSWIYIVLAVVVVCTSVAAFFAVKAFKYQQLLSQAETLKKDLDDYDKKIARANANPDANRAELEKLINELEAKERSFSSLSDKIDQDDFGKFYNDPIEKDIDGILQQFGETDYHIPKEMVERVKYHIGVYTGTLHGTMGRYLKRKEKYFPMIQKAFREKNLPVELSYISMLESGFNPMALSPVGARGLWQFMPATGKRFGLAIEGDYDERTDPEKATVAATEYFKDLIGMFGGKSSVMLCMAAYNAGEGRIMGALRKIEDPMRNRDFWYIYRMGYLAEETNEYIPRVIAMMIISKNPARFGFEGSAPVNEANLETANDFVPVPSVRQ